MSLFYLLKGITDGTAQYVQQQRQINRQREDAELAHAYNLASQMMSSPDFAPENYATMLHYMANLGNPRGRASGKQGFLGAAEADSSPITQLVRAATQKQPGEKFDPTQTHLPGLGQKDVNDTSFIGNLVSGGATEGGNAPTTAMAPEPKPAGSVMSAPPLPTAPASPVAGAPGGQPQGEGPMPGGGAMQPLPTSALPQPPGTGGMLQATNALAQDSQVAPGPQGPSSVPAPPKTGTNWPSGLSDADLAGAKQKRTGLFYTPDEKRIMADREKFSGSVAASQGQAEGLRQELKQMLGREPTFAELRQYKSGQLSRQSPVWTAHPTDPSREVLNMRDSFSGALTPSFDDGGQPVTRLKAQGVSRAMGAQDAVTSGAAPDLATANRQIAARNTQLLNTKLDTALAGIKDKNVSTQLKQKLLQLKDPAEALQILSKTDLSLGESLALAKGLNDAARGLPVDPNLLNVRAVSGTTKTMEEGATLLQPHIADAVQQAKQLDQAGLFGPVMSRVRQHLEKAGTVDEFARLVGADPELNNDARVGDFASTLGLLATGAGRVHGGARGGGSPVMLDHFKSMLSDAGTVQMFEGRLNALDKFMGGYAAGPNAPRRGTGNANPAPIPPPGTVHMRDSTGDYHIPANKLQAFKQAHPQAQAIQ